MFLDYCPVCRLPGLPNKLCPSCSCQAVTERFDTFMVRCPSCFHPLVSELYVCPECSMKIYSVYDYSASFVRRIVVRWKLEAERKLSPLVSGMFYDTLTELGLTPDKYCLTKVPSSRKGKRNRGWDHMSDVLLFLKHKYNYSISDILVTNKDSPVQQKNLNRAQRFEVARSRYKLKTKYTLPTLPLVILDDITTTGASLHACKNILEENNLEVWGAVTLLQEL